MSRLTPEEREYRRTLCGYDGCRKFVQADPDLFRHLTLVHQLEQEQALRVCDAERRRFELAHFKSQVPERAKDWTLDSFPAADVEGRRAHKAARKWIEGDAEFYPRLFIHGTPASGKTGLACGIGRRWLSYGYDFRVEFENVRALLEAQKASFAPGKSKVLGHLLVEAWDTDGLLVILDDVGAGRQTEFAVETVALIIEHLHALDVPLIVTTNYAPDELARRLGHADPIEGLRIVSRLCEDARVIPLSRPDLRLSKAGDQRIARENEATPLRRDDDEGGESPPRRHQGGERRRKGHTA